MIVKVRAAHPAILLGGVDYYNALAPYLVHFKYTDNCDGKKADDVEFELADREGKFISTWMPAKGATFDASIITERWFTPFAPALSLDCGQFWIDRIEFVLPDHKVKVKANSIPTTSQIKSAKDTRGWEKTTLRDIAGQIATENGMQLDYRAQANPRYGRTEKHEESDLGFLAQRCLDAKLAIKVARNKLTIFDEQTLEEAAAAFSLVYGDRAVASTGPTYRISAAHFVTQLVDTSKKAKVSSVNPENGELNSGLYDASKNQPPASTTATGSSSASVTQADIDQAKAALEFENAGDKIDHDTDVDDSSEGDDGGGDLRSLIGTDFSGESGAATLKAKSHVREKNKKKDQCRVDLSLGNPLVAAGQTCNIVGCGQFDGKWFVESAHHSLAPEYKTELVIRRCLVGY